jgi:ribosomal protein S18 acetylase RimI-like enzyme
MATPMPSPTVRPARPQDLGAADLLYLSAAAHYDRFAGSRERALHILRTVFGHAGHSASYEVCLLAELDGEPAGVLAGFPLEDEDRYTRRFLHGAMLRIPLTRWPGIARSMWVAAQLTPPPPLGSWYVDALAVHPSARRRGVASALLDAAAARAVEEGCRFLALDTDIENAAARATYERTGMTPGELHRASEGQRRSVAASGFVGYAKRLERRR